MKKRLEIEIATLRLSLESVSEESDTERHLLERLATLTEQHTAESTANDELIEKLRSDIEEMQEETEMVSGGLLCQYFYI